MKKIALLATLPILVAVLGSIFVFKTTVTSGTTTTEEYKQQIRNGLAEINLPNQNNSNAINSVPENLSNFINYRSGVQISQTNKNLLQTTEQNFWNDSRRIDASELAQILTLIATERTPNLTNTDITSITDSLRGFNDSALPAGFQQGRNTVKLRSNGTGRMTATSFTNELTNFRDGGIESKIAQNLIYSSLSLQVNNLASTLKESDPDFFGETKSDMTPAQAVLISYAVIANDPLTNNQTTLAQKMTTMQQGISQSTGQQYPSPQNHKAFGDNGYIYSSPVSLVFNDASVMRLLNLIQERGN